MAATGWDIALADAGPDSVWFWGYNRNTHMLEASSGIFEARADAHSFVIFGIPNGNYNLYKLPASNGHSNQILLRTPVPLWGAEEVVPGRPSLDFEADTLYILTHADDTPNYEGDTSGLLALSPPCGNWRTHVYQQIEATRSQTWGILAAIRANREKAIGIKACIAARMFDSTLDLGILAAIQKELQLDIGIQAAILGEASRYLPIRAAIRTERLLEPAIIAAVGKDFSLISGATATVQGNTEVHSHLKAAVKGETERTASIKAFVVNTRVDHILLEMENLFPQELDLRSTPNWASKVKDYRKSNLSARDS